MFIVLTKDDFNALSPSTRAELLASLGAKPKAILDEGFPDWFYEQDHDVIDLTPGEIETFMGGCSQQTIDGLKVFAEHGPVISAHMLDDADIDNYAHFQGRVTKRTRTVTGDKHAFLLAWDNWQEASDGIGHYAVTQATFRSLRVYFNID